MTARLAGTQLWQRNLASLIRSGLFSKAVTGEANGLFTVVGIYTDETCSAPLAKFSDWRRAAEAANLVNRIALVQGPVESNCSGSLSRDHPRPWPLAGRGAAMGCSDRVSGEGSRRGDPGDLDEPSG
jgi:hypothetical protein